ncbi:MAG TPA: molecular chaperone DnaJ [Cellvibrionaceae bacterium]
MLQLMLIVGVIAAVYYHFKIKPMPAAEQKKMFWRLAIWAAAALAILGVMTGRVHWLGGVAAGAFALLRSGLFTGLTVGRFWLAKNGGVARFTTEHLAAELDVNQLNLNGLIKKGPYAGQTLQQLDKNQLEELLEYYQTRDKKSYYLIKTLLQRRGFYGEHQNYNQDSSPPAISDVQEALDILGLSGTPTKNDILAAHRKLIHKLHPDRGGSDYLASQVNAARDQLLKRFDN